MADHSLIEWTDATWNPITGCSVVSPGCTNCYAMKLAGTRLKHIPSRKGLTRDSKAGPVWTGEVRLNEEWLDQPLRWKAPRRIFVCAHGDLFAENVPDEWIDRVFAVMALAPQHTFQVLTKRASRMREYLTAPGIVRRIYELACDLVIDQRLNIVLLAPGITPPDPSLAPNAPRVLLDRWPLPNVWLGVSAEDQLRANARIPELLATPAAVRFLSAEPLLGPIDLHEYLLGFPAGHPAGCACGHGHGFNRCRNYGKVSPTCHKCSCDHFRKAYGSDGVHWIIVGGESGRGARPMHPAWVRRIRDQCATASVPFFFKQWGAWADFTDIEPKPVCSEDRIFTATGNVIGVGVDHGRKGMVDPEWQNQGAAWMGRVSKSYAGRLLDGVEHNAMPEVS
ncbi:phage Gp37/Gp68 family protein [Aminobacter sp. NyZ550]|uniref:DUF5131 family protein n=1 Tax=Aminobacter sp. NyZ550 TaxID=2979870 RepID=UPI0021D577EC|nr:phage Gp37/Gp68 family protein [Aminobacter sp. NyZ550]WAX93160.1 phage Gp37/Gp68 family protein [Aminobacter sp. NyZ550]